jgi:hypothetical protein
MSPFERMSRRTIRRLGSPVSMIDDSGLSIPEKLGVYESPEKEGIVSGGGGRLEFKSQNVTLLMLSDDVQGINKDWKISVCGREYYPVKWPDDGAGCVLITLGTPSLSEGGENGNWR